jgi:cytoskeletal protein RodZ
MEKNGEKKTEKTKRKNKPEKNGKKQEKKRKNISWGTLLRGGVYYFVPGLGVLYCGWFTNAMWTLQ